MKSPHFVPALMVLAALALPAVADLRAGNLTCEHRTSPLGLDVARPRLSWTLQSDRRGAMQSAYRVLAASSADKLAQDQGDLWDSGKVASDQSVLVEYAGKLPAGGQRVFWKVRPYDAAGAEGPWSETAWFETGLLRADWKAKWIGSPTADDFASKHGREEPNPMLRKAFTLDKPVRRARLYICGLGFADLRVNGTRMDQKELDPPFTRYDRRCLYTTWDVTAALKQGPNVLGVVLGNGWYNFQIKAAWDFDKAPWRGRPRLLLQVEAELEDGSRVTVVSDESWKVSTGPIVYDCLLNGETYDARLEKAGWDACGYDDAAWAAAKVVEAPKGVLSANNFVPAERKESLKPVKATQPKPGLTVYDLGQNIAGVVQVAVVGPAGATVELRYGERLNEDGTLDQKDIAQHTRQGDFQTDRYILKGGGEETWRPSFVYHGFQYVQVSAPAEVRVKDLRGIVISAGFECAGGFACSNDLLNRIQRAAQWAYVGNFVHYPTDCPHREKNGWTGDAHLAAEMGLLNFDPAAAYAKWVQDMQDEQRPSGELPGIVPTGGWGYAWGNGPAWDSAYLLIPWYMYQYRGDRRILETHYENFKRYVDYLTGKSKDGIVEIGLGDWCPARTQTPAKVTSTGYYFADATIVSRIAALLGKPEEAEKYARLAQAARAAWNREFLDGKSVDPKTKKPLPRTQTLLACGLYQGLVDQTRRDEVLRDLVADVEAKGGHLDCGILGTKYILHALTDNGRTDLAYRIVTQKDFPSWGHWIEQGATTLWEEWNGKQSRNHIMFGDVSAWFIQTLAGIRTDPAGPGFKKIVIRPEPAGELTWARGETQTPYGQVSSSWKIADGTFSLDVTIPVNTTATVYVPARDAAAVTEGGKAVGEGGGIKAKGRHGGFAVFEVGSGLYHFQAPR